MKNSIILLFLFGLFNVAFADSYNDMSCKKYSQISEDDVLVEMIRSSNFNFAKWYIKPKEVNAFCDKEENKIVCQIGIDNTNSIKDETASFSPIGTVSYNILTSKLYNISINLEEPKELKYKKTWKEIFNALNNGDDVQYVILHKKKYLYNFPNENTKSKKFLIKNDCAVILKKKSNDWFKIYFYNQKLGTNTVLWIKNNNITILKGQKK